MDQIRLEHKTYIETISKVRKNNWTPLPVTNKKRMSFKIVDLNQLNEKISGDKVDQLLGLSHLKILPCLRLKGTIEMGQQTLKEELAKLNSERGLSIEVDEINNIPPEEWHERDFSRLGMANNAKQRTVSSVQEDTINYEQAQNGLNINREERLKLDEIRSSISFNKKKN